jgi:hypothetical protein
MDLATWLETHHPGRGGRTFLQRKSGCNHETIARALAGDPILTEPAAQRLSDATNKAVTVAELMAGGVRAKPKREVVRKLARKTRKTARRKSAANRKTSAVRKVAA